MTEPSAGRLELKFLVHYRTRLELLERWSPHLVPAPYTDAHAMTPILSQYYDSPGLAFYWEKLEGLPSRRKVRVRTYAMEFAASAATFLEIKHREGDVLSKLRHRVPGFSNELLEPASWTALDSTAAASLLELRERYRLRRSAQVYFQREAYQGVNDPHMRITLDTGVIALHPGERLSTDLLLDRSRHLIADTLAILEIKAHGRLPAWVHRGIVSAELTRKSIPKYVAAVEHLGLHRSCQSGDLQ